MNGSAFVGDADMGKYMRYVRVALPTVTVCITGDPRIVVIIPQSPGGTVESLDEPLSSPASPPSSPASPPSPPAGVPELLPPEVEDPELPPDEPVLPLELPPLEALELLEPLEPSEPLDPGSPPGLPWAAGLDVELQPAH